jgi:predicted NUDIX family phosphoesterase
MSEELVLVVPAAALIAAGIPQGFTTDVSASWSKIVSTAQFSYLPRSVAEVDPTHKQIIPYCLIRRRQGDSVPQFYAYYRSKKQGEQRLHGKRSLGIGGHVNPCDAHADVSDYLAGLKRELAEELVLPAYQLRALYGIVNDDSNDVGKVHVGVVHICDVDTDAVAAVDDTEMLDGCLMSLAELVADVESFEIWSQLILRELAYLYGIQSS